MLIRTKMIVSTTLVLVLVALVGGVFLSTYWKIPQRLAEVQRVNELSRELFSLNISLFDFHFPESRERGLRQWNSTYVRIQEHMLDLQQADGIESRLLEQMTRSHGEIGELFDRLKHIPPEESPVVSRLMDQIIVKIKDMVMYSHLLITSSQGALKQTQRRADILIMVAISGIVAITLIASSLFHITILHPIWKLRKGAEAVSRGELDYQIEVTSTDEIGQLTKMFNRMTKNLNTLTKARDEFLSTAAHELKTPLTIIKTYMQLMNTWSPQEAQDQFPKALKILIRQSDRMNKLTQDLLDVSRLQIKNLVLKKQLVDMRDIVSRAVSDLQNTSEHKLVILANDSAIVEADPNRIEQVISNLIDNAIKYSPTGGEIEVSSVRQDDEVIVSIRDYGIGIPPSHQARIFEKYYRAHIDTAYDYATSMGIGLYLAQEFVKVHNGRIWFVSEEGKGSTFFFSLPTKTAQEE